jgi:hypothetical protein
VRFAESGVSPDACFPPCAPAASPPWPAVLQALEPPAAPLQRFQYPSLLICANRGISRRSTVSLESRFMFGELPPPDQDTIAAFPIGGGGPGVDALMQSVREAAQREKHGAELRGRLVLGILGLYAAGFRGALGLVGLEQDPSVLRCAGTHDLAVQCMISITHAPALRWPAAAGPPTNPCPLRSPRMRDAVAEAQASLAALGIDADISVNHRFADYE